MERKEQPKPWGCPDGHCGLGEQLPVQAVPVNIHTPRTPKQQEQQVTPRAKVRRRLDTNENKSPAPQPAPGPAHVPAPRPIGVARKTTAPPVNPQRMRQRAAKAACTNRNQELFREKVEDELRDISSGSGSEEEYVPNADEVAESGDDHVAPARVAPAPQPAPELAPDVADEQDDDEEQYEEFLDDQLMEDIFVRLSEGDSFQKRVYVPDDEDDQVLKRQIIAPLLEGGGLFQKHGSNADDRVLDLDPACHFLPSSAKPKLQLCWLAEIAL